jgi:hypothetical protein
MSVESKKVLEMLMEGKITAADAERLLDKLSASPETIADGTTKGTIPGSGVKKFLRVMIERPLGADVNVRVPLTFVRSGISLAGVLPPKVMEQLQQEGIDPRFFMQHASDTLDELNVDMETKTGKRIRVFCE